MNPSFNFLWPVMKTTPARFGWSRVLNYSTDLVEIKIPKRIIRGPTDILKVLSTTVGIDPTAAHYKFHDDPYLMPYSNPSKRSYALSQEAGRKAAHWIRQQHADLFQHKVADPLIEAYVPEIEYSDDSVVNEDVLLSLIDKQLVSDAITVYEIMKKRNADVGVETKQKMLELVCFYNSQDPLSDKWLEENWFRQTSSLTKRTIGRMGLKVWKDGGFAEKMFDEVVQCGGDVAKAHCALIAGMLQHGQVDQAWKKYEECKQKKIELNVHVYNGLLGKSSVLRESHEFIWQLTKEFLVEMHEMGIRPNLDTLNSVLGTLEIISSNRNSKQNAMSTIAEFKKLGIEPSLASFAHLIRIFYKDQVKLSGVIRSIIEILENDRSILVPRCIGDNTFFTTAMEAINTQLRDKILGEKLDSILHNAPNYTLIGNSYSESLYYRNYFKLMMVSEGIDEFMEFYYKFVPNLYVPEVRVTQELLDNIEIQMGWKYLPKLWGDIILFDQIRQELVSKLLSIAVLATVEDSNQVEAMATMAWAVWGKIQSGNVRNFEWTGEMLGDILSILATGKELGKAHIVMDKIDRSRDSVTGEPSPSSLEKYVDASLEAGNIDGALRCAKYSSASIRPETESILNKITNCGIKLDGPQERIVYELQKNR